MVKAQIDLVTSFGCITSVVAGHRGYNKSWRPWGEPPP
jgi:hypothetical protein